MPEPPGRSHAHPTRRSSRRQALGDSPYPPPSSRPSSPRRLEAIATASTALRGRAPAPRTSPLWSHEQPWSLRSEGRWEWRQPVQTAAPRQAG